MSTLAQRLVDAVRDAICTAVCGGTTREDFACSPDDWTRESDAAVVAVLRGLAAAGEEQMRMYHPSRLRALADSIKGVEVPGGEQAKSPWHDRDPGWSAIVADSTGEVP